MEKRFSIYAQHKLLPILVLCTLIVPIYFIFFFKHGQDHFLLEDILTLERPSTSLNLTLQTHDGIRRLYHLDLSLYPIEANILATFPKTEPTIKRILAAQLLNTDYTENRTDQPLNACEQHPLPYPLLRQLMREYFPDLKNQNSLFDDPLPSHQQKDPYILVFPESSTVCVRIIVPFQNKTGTLYRPHPFQHAHITSPWWDTFVTSLRDIDTNATIPIHLQPWPGHMALRQSVRQRQINPNLPEWAMLRQELVSEREKTHVYEATIDLPQAGRWEISSVVEFVEGRYNFEAGPVTPYEPILLHPTLVVNRTQVVEEPLPLCEGFDHPGRWLDAPEGHAATRNGKYWAPFTCRYRQMTYEEFFQCVNKKYPKGINVFGDSNSRRSIKKLLSRGKWCLGWEKHPLSWKEDDKHDAEGYRSPEEYTYLHVNQTKSCFCEDYREYGWNASWFDATARMSTLQLDKANNVTMHSYKWDGLTYLNDPGWETAVPLMPVDVDVAIFSLGNWDAAYSQLDTFLHGVDQLIQQIRDHYDLNKTKIIYRTPQYYCCRVDTSVRARQVSGPRLALFHQEARARFQSQLNASVWDTYILGESKTWDEKKASIGCSSNHVPADEVEIENQILMNGLCNSLS